VARGDPRGAGEGVNRGAAGRAARRLAATARVNSLARRVAAARGRGLALVYHRVGRPGGGAIPTMPEGLFARQVRVLKELGSVVRLEELLRPDPSGRVRFALTFDDDYRSHLERVLPVLIDEGVGATFFLSGRSLFGRGPYPFEVLDHLLQERAQVEIAHALGVDARDVDELLRACASDPSTIGGAGDHDVAADHLGSQDIHQLAASGMAIGFHTLEHAMLTALSQQELEDAVRRGRAELEDAAGVPLPLFAYPFGRADGRTAAAVRGAGFSAAVTGIPGPVSPRTDPFLIPRWEPGPLNERAFAAEVAIRLHRRAGGP
jgi:peptidoglycan/xylan/chitin deacetylase (PgdA/CDA1 family)